MFYKKHLDKSRNIIDNLNIKKKIFFQMLTNVLPEKRCATMIARTLRGHTSVRVEVATFYSRTERRVKVRLDSGYIEYSCRNRTASQNTQLSIPKLPR